MGRVGDVIDRGCAPVGGEEGGRVYVDSNIVTTEDSPKLIGVKVGTSCVFTVHVAEVPVIASFLVVAIARIVH